MTLLSELIITFEPEMKWRNFVNSVVSVRVCVNLEHNSLEKDKELELPEVLQIGLHLEAATRGLKLLTCLHGCIQLDDLQKR